MLNKARIDSVMHMQHLVGPVGSQLEVSQVELR